jgi:hypothetical protein
MKRFLLALMLMVFPGLGALPACACPVAAVTVAVPTFTLVTPTVATATVLTPVVVASPTVVVRRAIVFPRRAAVVVRVRGRR